MHLWIRRLNMRPLVVDEFIARLLHDHPRSPVVDDMLANDYVS